MEVNPVSAVSSASSSTETSGSASESSSASEYKAVAEAKLNSAIEGVLVGFLFSQLGDMRKTVSKTSSEAKERLNDMKELDAESE